MGTKKNTIFGEKEVNKLSYVYQQTHRSNFFIKDVKHCFETTYVDECRFMEIGFTPNNYDRTFITFYNYGVNSKSSLLERYDNKDNNTIVDLFLTINKTIMVCLDSLNSNFTIVLNNETRSRTFSNIKNYRSWYAAIAILRVIFWHFLSTFFYF